MMPSQMPAFSVEQYLNEVAVQVDSALDQYLPRPDTYSGRIVDAMRYSVHGAGKRLRAALAIETASVCGGRREKAMPAAVAIEAIHAYSLIHDDLPCMDDDDYRRGKPSNHIKFGDGMAVLAGDALNAFAFHMLARLPRLSGVGAEQTVQIIDEIAVATGTGGMIGGQVADLLAEGKEPDPERLAYIHSYKTGALITASARVGAIIAGAPAHELTALTTYANHFGVAFQIVDDLLDVVGDSDVLGKETGSDEKQGKLTFPRIYGVDESRRMAENEIAEAVASLAIFGDRAYHLEQLAFFVLERKK